MCPATDFGSVLGFTNIWANLSLYTLLLTQLVFIAYQVVDRLAVRYVSNLLNLNLRPQPTTQPHRDRDAYTVALNFDLHPNPDPDSNPNPSPDSNSNP